MTSVVQPSQWLEEGNNKKSGNHDQPQWLVSLSRQSGYKMNKTEQILKMLNKNTKFIERNFRLLNKNAKW